ncbi:MAG: hypothetical protein DMG35_18170 [Acidobacteria bacterium]|nr:MAG: hypothetical protein AUH86_07325 [Acidobacteria bacterium 13_1_40CM_4_58_4]PYT58350.1 MAG: hypothetical protein DMG35_18170 [Acidobacteriota bacterium]
MSKPSALTILGLVTTCAPLFWAQSPQAPDLPPGEMQAKARTACLECHEARIILQQRLNKAAWTREVDKMIKWGALVGPKDRDPLIDYFSVNFPPEKAPEPAVRVKKKQ